MAKVSLAIAGCITVLGAGFLYLQADQQQATPSPRSQSAAPQSKSINAAPPSPPIARAVIDKYCVVCHNGKLKTAGLLLDSLDVEHVGHQAEVWEKVARKFRTGEM